MIGLIVAQRIKYSDKIQTRIEKIGKALNGTLEPPPLSGERKVDSMQQKIKIFFS